MAKPFLTYEQLLDKLITEKKLTINSKNEAEAMLKRLSYFSLVSGYKDPFKNPSTGTYKYGIEFGHLVELYNFDEQLREIFLRYMMKIERMMSSLISYYFSLNFGDQQQNYLDVNNYDYSYANIHSINKLIAIMSDLCNTHEYSYINHHRKNHQNIPLWIIINAMTFGQISKMFGLLKQSMKSNITKNIPNVMHFELEKMLKVLTKFRNVCAHGERLYSYKTVDGIPDMRIHQSLNIPKTGHEYKFGKHDLFAVVIMYKYLLDPRDFYEFASRLDNAVNCYVSKMNSMSEHDLLLRMGFPINWKEINQFPDS